MRSSTGHARKVTVTPLPRPRKELGAILAPSHFSRGFQRAAHGQPLQRHGMTCYVHNTSYHCLCTARGPCCLVESGPCRYLYRARHGAKTPYSYTVAAKVQGPQLDKGFPRTGSGCRSRLLRRRRACTQITHIPSLACAAGDMTPDQITLTMVAMAQLIGEADTCHCAGCHAGPGGRGR